MMKTLSKAPSIAAPINIWSGSDISLGAALTNPTCLAYKKGKLKQQYPITVFGTVYGDVETAYQTHKKECDSEIGLLLFMQSLITIKLLSYPQLYQAIKKRGGTNWLKTCSHNTSSRKKPGIPWEGVGMESAFIACLVSAYEFIETNSEFYPIG